MLIPRFQEKNKAPHALPTSEGRFFYFWKIFYTQMEQPGNTSSTMERNEVGPYHPLPQPDEIPIREREDAMGAYLMMFAAIGAGLPLPIINLIAAIIYYYLNRAKSRFVHFHSLQALLSQAPTTLMNAALLFWTLSRAFYQDCGFKSCPYWEEYVGYIWVVVIANILYFVFSIIAAIRARQGRMYYLVFFGKLSYHYVFQVKEKERETVVVNAPPKM